MARPIPQRAPSSDGLREFNPNHDRLGRFAHAGATQVGLTSAKPGHTAEEAVFTEMAGFAQQLRGLHGVSQVHVSAGQGVYQGASEPTWVIAYRGNGEARRLVARTAKAYGQESALILKPCKGQNCQPSVELSFHRPLSQLGQRDVHDAMVKQGISGGTWVRNRGLPRLRMVSVPQWGGERLAHLNSTRALSQALAAAGYSHSRRVRGKSVEVLDAGNYDLVIGGS